MHRDKVKEYLLLPCPWCGKTETLDIKSTSGEGHFVVECGRVDFKDDNPLSLAHDNAVYYGCWVCGPEGLGVEEAVRLWNLRYNSGDKSEEL